VYHPDRLMRQPRDLEELLALSEEHDITLHGQANRRDLSDPDDRFFLRIEVAHACRSSDDTSRRLRDALEDRAREGRVHTGAKRPYGYAPGGMVIIENEAEAVREVFARYLDGDTLRQIARRLNERGVPTAEGCHWAPQSVRAVVSSRHVTGIRVFRGRDFGDGNWPVIIDRGTWTEAQDRRAYRALPYARPFRFYLLRGW
jgi:DNA invertase Pin-like site-specific DNA recombinase